MLAMPNLTSLLLHGNRLSGTLIANESTPPLQTLSLANNYFGGTTNALEPHTNLETLLLSSMTPNSCFDSVFDLGGAGNHFSCEVATLNASNLGRGTWTDPSKEALIEVGADIAQRSIVNPYSDVELVNRSNTCLVLAGNAEARLRLMYSLY